MNTTVASSCFGTTVRGIRSWHGGRRAADRGAAWLRVEDWSIGRVLHEDASGVRVGGHEHRAGVNLAPARAWNRRRGAWAEATDHSWVLRGDWLQLQVDAHDRDYRHDYASRAVRLGLGHKKQPCSWYGPNEANRQHSSFLDTCLPLHRLELTCQHGGRALPVSRRMQGSAGTGRDPGGGGGVAPVSSGPGEVG